MRNPDALKMRRDHRSIDPVFLDTPVFKSDHVSRISRADVFFKDERASPIRSFKGRGADLMVRSLPPGAHLVCASAGNFGQGMAWAVRRHAGRLTVFAATTAARCKIEAMRAFGAEVILGGADFDDAKEAARDFAATSGKIFIEDGDHAEIAEGAGTIAVELTDEAGEFDSVFVPLGNGSLAAGIGCWFKHHSPRTRVVAVCAEGAPAMGRAVLDQPYCTATCSTIADGIAVRVPSSKSVEFVRSVVDKVLFVSEADIRYAMKLIEEETADVVEAAGAVGLAGLIACRTTELGKRVAIPICGGNRDLDAPRENQPTMGAMPYRTEAP